MTIATIKKTICCCSMCQVEKETKPGKIEPKLPRGWKRWQDNTICSQCWKKQYVLRSVYLPIASPITKGISREERVECWKILRDKLKVAWRQSTEASRWALKQLLANDIIRTKEDKKLPPMPPIYLYGMGNWNGWAGSAAAVLRTIEKQYKEKRYDMIWRGNSRLPDVRYPRPYPVKPNGWNLEFIEEKPIFTVALLEISVRLKGGHHYKSHTETLHQIANKAVLSGEASIYPNNRGQIIIRISYWKAIKDLNVKKTGTLSIRTDKDRFLIGTSGSEKWVINADRIRQCIVKHDKYQKRMREDLKLERRPMDKLEKEDSKKSSNKFNHRINSFIKEAAAQIIGYTVRRKFARLQVDLTCKDYLNHFPWFNFTQQLKNKAQENNIEIEIVEK